MGDSDDDRSEYDRRRRDKFRGERNDYDNRRPPPRGYERGRGDRSHTNTWERGSKRDYYGRDQGNRDRRDSFGRSGSPFKKPKREWENDPPWKGGQDTSMLMIGDKNTSAPSVPILMSFKDFIIQQEDSIDEAEAVRRYQEYKVEFKRTQINDFFVLHKAEEWFEEKYHPIKSVERKNTIRYGLRKRLKLFLDLWELGYLDNLSLNISNSVTILKLLDRVVIKLEGGTNEDMKALDLPPPKPEIPEKGEEDNIKVEIVLPEEGEMNESSIAEKVPESKSYNYDADGAEDEEGEPNEPLPPGMEDEEEIEPPGIEDEDSKADGGNEDDQAKKDEDSESKKKADETMHYVYDGSQVKRPYSLFMRIVPANVTRNDLIGVCKRYPGFLRIAMSDPSAERRYARRAWASFDHTVNIKDICWNLSNIRVKDVELSPVVNRDVSNRVRPVNGITCSPMTMQLDVNFALKLLKKLDRKHQLFDKVTNGHVDVTGKDKDGNGETVDDNSVKKEDELLGIPDKNPLFSILPENIAEIVTGLEKEDEEDDKKDYPILVDTELATALDMVLLYLRIVHCIDYYNANEYLHEDEMPMRCGIMHVRAVPLEAASKKDVYEWFHTTSSKLEHILKDDDIATDEEAEKFGKKNEEVEVENFIKANTQELAKDKWLCPLSGKKFRGPEFIRKHIIVKHSSNVEDVKTEVKFFNNYIYDLRRPCFPDPKPRITLTGGSLTGGSLTAGSLTGANTTPVANVRPSMLSGSNTLLDNKSWNSTPSQPSLFSTPRPAYTPPVYPTSTPQSQPSETYGRMNSFPPKAIRRGGGGSFRDRRLIKYRDLDAPEESDFF